MTRLDYLLNGSVCVDPSLVKPLDINKLKDVYSATLYNVAKDFDDIVYLLIQHSRWHSEMLQSILLPSYRLHDKWYFPLGFDVKENLPDGHRRSIYKSWETLKQESEVLNAESAFVAFLKTLEIREVLLQLLIALCVKSFQTSADTQEPEIMVPTKHELPSTPKKQAHLSQLTGTSGAQVMKSSDPVSNVESQKKVSQQASTADGNWDTILTQLTQVQHKAGFEDDDLMYSDDDDIHDELLNEKEDSPSCSNLMNLQHIIDDCLDRLALWQSLYSLQSRTVSQHDSQSWDPIQLWWINYVDGMLKSIVDSSLLRESRQRLFPVQAHSLRFSPRKRSLHSIERSNQRRRLEEEQKKAELANLSPTMRLIRASPNASRKGLISFKSRTSSDGSDTTHSHVLVGPARPASSLLSGSGRYRRGSGRVYGASRAPSRKSSLTSICAPHASYRKISHKSSSIDNLHHRRVSTSGSVNGSRNVSRSSSISSSSSSTILPEQLSRQLIRSESATHILKKRSTSHASAKNNDIDATLRSRRHRTQSMGQDHTVSHSKRSLSSVAESGSKSFVESRSRPERPLEDLVDPEVLNIIQETRQIPEPVKEPEPPIAPVQTALVEATPEKAKK